jgi:hypothetical protein
VALVLADRVQQTGTANTTVSFTLSGSVTGFQSFAVVGNGNTTYYSSFDASGNWEVGIGTYATGGTLTRTTIISSSNSGSAVTFSGQVNVFITQPSGNTVVSSNNAGTSGYVLTSNGTGVAPSWQAGGVGTITVTDFTATASQTTFTVSYTVGLVEVYRNGAKLGIADYTATSGTNIVLATGATAGDLIEVVAFSALNLATAVSSISFGSTGLTPSTASSGVVNVAGTLAAGYGGTGITSSGSSGNVLTSNGTGWTSAPIITSSTTTPVSPSLGNLWFNSNYGDTYVYYNDGTTNNWVSAEAGSTGIDFSSFDGGPAKTLAWSTISTINGGSAT